MKKISIILLAVVICFFMSFNGAAAKEKTLDQLEAEAKANRAAYNKAKNQKALSEKERVEATKQKAQVENEIKSINNQLTVLEKEIAKIQKDIEKKDKEIKEIMKFVQVSNGESAYLEYAFGASSFTDFIYRVSVAEQLSDYNEKLIDSYNSDVKRLEKKQKELTSKQAELTKKEQELSVLEAKLTKEIETLSEGMLSKDEEYKTQIGLINSLKSLKCKGYETMSACKKRISSSIPSGGKPNNSINGIPSVNGTYMPLARGYVTSDYGQRSLDYHTGIDFSNRSVSNVYPVATGMVVYVKYGSTNTCGNHIVYVYHNIGRGYTTSYWHLTSSRVKKGDIVTPNTVLGQTGGPGYTDGEYMYGKYVQCAFGGHVHLNLFNGLTSSNSGRINPRILMPQIPREGTYFTR